MLLNLKKLQIPKKDELPNFEEREPAAIQKDGFRRTVISSFKLTVILLLGIIIWYPSFSVYCCRFFFIVLFRGIWFFYLVISALVIWCSSFFMVHTCRILFIVIFPWCSSSRFISMFWEMSFTKYDMVIIIFHWCRSRTYLHLAVWCRFHDSVVFIHCQFIMLHHFFHISLFSIVTGIFMVTVICTKYCLPCDSFFPLCM